MVLFGTFRNGANPNHFTIFQVATMLGLWGVVMSAVYMLRAYRSTFMGTASHSRPNMTDLRKSLPIPIGILLAISIWFGCFPQSLIRIVSPTFETYFLQKR